MNYEDRPRTRCIAENYTAKYFMAQSDTTQSDTTQSDTTQSDTTHSDTTQSDTTLSMVTFREPDVCEKCDKTGIQCCKYECLHGDNKFTIEPNWFDDEEDYESTYQTMDPVFEMLFKPLDDPYFQPTPHLEELDEQLSIMYYESLVEPPVKMIHTREDGVYEPSMEEVVFNFAKTLEIGPSEAFEYLRRCHNCGNTDMKLCDVYCNQRCQSLCEDFEYPCFWEDDCMLCNNSNFKYWNIIP